MTNDRNTQGAWLTVPSPDGLPTEVADEIGDISERIGFVPNVARLLAITPSHFVGWWKYFDELMRGPSGLTKTQREMIAVVISAESRCPYCETAHSAALRLRTKDPALVDRLAVNYRHVELDARDRTMLDFAVKLTKRHPAHRRGDRHLQLQRPPGDGDWALSEPRISRTGPVANQLREARERFATEDVAPRTQRSRGQVRLGQVASVVTDHLSTSGQGARHPGRPGSPGRNRTHKTNGQNSRARSTFLKKRSVSTVFDEVEGRFLWRPRR